MSARPSERSRGRPQRAELSGQPVTTRAVCAGRTPIVVSSRQFIEIPEEEYDSPDAVVREIVAA